MEARELFALLDHAGDAAFAVEPDGPICYWSSKAEALLGFTKSETLSKNCDGILRGEDGNGCAVCTRDCQILESARRNRDVANYDLYAQTALGDRRWLNISIIVAHVKQGPSPLVVHLMRDISQRKRNENLTREIMLRVGELTGRQADQLLNRDRSQQPPPDLTARELSILKALSLGRSTKQLSDELHISPATVRNHIQHVLGKLKCHTRLEAVLRATRQGII
jgi:PAS domain S-box-containing protein